MHKTKGDVGWGWMFLNILRISVSNVLKMFLNLIDKTNLYMRNTKGDVGWGWMFLNIWRISASNVLKIFLNLIVSIEYAVDIFHKFSYIKPIRRTDTLYWISRYPGRQERNF